MHITSTYARKAPRHLLRESYWENGKVKKRTLANLSALPQHLIDLLRLAFANQLPAGHDGSALALGPAHQHGAVSAVLGTARRLQIDSLLFSRPCRQRSLALAMIVSRLLCPGSKLRVERELGPAGRSTLAAGSLALYDVSSSYLEGSRCELASRDHCPDRPQIVYGLLGSPRAAPSSSRPFPATPPTRTTLAARVQVLRERFGLQRVALVGDRGMIAQTRIDADLQPAGFDWITALRGDTLRKLVKRNVIQSGLFDTPGLASVTCEEYPGERLLVCYNPLVAAERRRKRNVLLELTAAPGQALRVDVRRADGGVQLPAEAGVDPGGGAFGRDLRDPHEPAGGAVGGRRDGAGVQEPGAGGAGLPVAEVAAGGAVGAGQAQGPHARDAGGEPAAAELPGPAGTPDDALGAGVAAGGGSGAPCVEAERADAVAGAGVRTAGEQAAPGTAPGADSGRTCGT